MDVSLVDSLGITYDNRYFIRYVEYVGSYVFVSRVSDTGNLY